MLQSHPDELGAQVVEGHLTGCHSSAALAVALALCSRYLVASGSGNTTTKKHCQHTFTQVTLSHRLSAAAQYYTGRYGGVIVDHTGRVYPLATCTGTASCACHWQWNCSRLRLCDPARPCLRTFLRLQCNQPAGFKGQRVQLSTCCM